MDDNFFSINNNYTEDISSSSAGYKYKNIKAYAKSPKPIINHLGTIVKIISFTVAIFIIGISFVASYFLYSAEPLFKVICALIIFFGAVTASVFLFIIFAIGHIVDQNNKILKQLDK